MNLYKHKQHGHKIVYRVFYNDGTHKERYKYSKEKGGALEIAQDAERLEHLSMKQRLTREEVIYFLHRKLIHPDEVTRITPTEEHADMLTALADPAGITWDTLETVYLQHIARVGTKTTRASYAYKIKPIRAYFESKKISPAAINIDLVREYITSRRQKIAAKSRLPITKATVNKEITALRIMLDHLVEKKILKENPARGDIKRFKESPARPPQAIHPEDLEIIMTALDTCPTRACFGYFPEIIQTYLLTGMRRYELLELERDNVDLRSRVITVKGKGEKYREIEIHDDLTSILKRVLEKNGRKKGKYFYGGEDHTLMDPNSVYRAFKTFIKRIELPGWITLHTLRHTWTSYMMDAGVPPHKVQQQAGHENMQTTLKYTHRVPGKSRAIDALDYGSYYGLKE